MKKILISCLFVLLMCIVLSLIITHILSVLDIYIFIDKTGLTENQYSPIVSDLILLIGFFAAIIPILTMWSSLKKLQANFENKHGIKSSPIDTEGEDDIEWMLGQFKGAKHITIFAGGFAWLNKKQGMKDLLQKLATEKKLDLISHGSEDYVREAFRVERATPLYNRLKECFIYNSGLDQAVVCTLVKDSTLESRFLYKGRSDSDGGAEFNACVLADADQNRVLLHILSELTRARHWDRPASVETDPTPEE